MDAVRNISTVILSLLACLLAIALLVFITNLTWVLTAPHLTPMDTFLQDFNFEIYLIIGVFILGRLLTHALVTKGIKTQLKNYRSLRNLMVSAFCLILLLLYFFGITGYFDYNFGLERYL